MIVGCPDGAIIDPCLDFWDLGGPVFAFGEEIEPEDFGQDAMLSFEETVSVGREDRGVHNFDVVLLRELDESLGFVTWEVVAGKGSRKRVGVEHGIECVD